MIHKGASSMRRLAMHVDLQAGRPVAGDSCTKLCSADLCLHLRPGTARAAVHPACYMRNTAALQSLAQLAHT